MAVIIDHAHQMPKGGVLVIGDSVAERNRFDTLCGLPTMPAPTSYQDEKHPDLIGAAQWRALIEQGCLKQKIP